MYYYYIYNFIIESDFEISLFEDYADIPRASNLTVIKLRRLNKEKKDEIFSAKTWDILTMKYFPLIPYGTEKHIVLKFLDLYFVAVSLTGKEIIVDLDSKDPKMSINVAMGGALSICMALHGYSPLHAMAVEYNKKPLVFIAPSKTGKSTLEYFFLNNGCKSITDDVLPVKLLNDKSTCFSSKNLKIKTDTKLASRFNIPLDISNIVTPLENKYWLSLSLEQHSHINHNLEYIFYLNPSNDYEEVLLTPISKIDSINMLVENLHFVQFYPKTKRNEAIKNVLINFKNIDVYSVNYKKEFHNITKIIDVIYSFVN